jgi:uncharacterized protein YndB with AHSA1/START domain
MDMTDTLHTTLVFERTIAARCEDVFDALSDPTKRSDWGAPSDTAVIRYDEADFREGGRDVFRCGPKDDPNIQGTTHYLDIIVGRRIVSSETITMGGKRLCASLNTVELLSHGDETRLTSTTQLASFIGQEMVNGHEAGTNASLDNLVAYFDRTKRI